MKKLIGSLGMLLFLLSSCLKDDMFNNQASLDFGSEGMAVVAVFNVVKSSDQLEVFLNNDLLNKVGETLKYRDLLRHRTVLPGKRTLTAQVRYGNRTQPVPPKDITLEQGKNYSIFMYGENAIGMTLVEDYLILPQQGKFKVRFANFNTAQDVANIGNIAGPTRYFTGAKPYQVTDFIELDISESSFLLSKDNRGANALPIELSPTSGGVYTVLVTAPHIGANDEEARPSLYTVFRHNNNKS